MIEIGQTKIVNVRRRDKATRKLMPVYNDHNIALTKIVASEVTRVTRNELGGHFGPDKHRKLVVKLAAGDVLVMWPQGTRQKVTLELKQVYSYAVRNKANIALLEKARQRKAAKANARANARMRYAEAKLRKPL